MKNLISLIVLSAALMCAAAADTHAADKLQVVVTHETLKSLVEAVGGPHVEVFSITRGTQDPHFVEAKPSFMTKARRADLWVRIGMEMEIGFERLILEGSRNAAIRVGGAGFLDVSLNVRRLEVPSGAVDRSMGDVHPQGNPHYWLDPLNGRIMARDIADKLATLDPAHATEYRKNFDTFAARLDAAMFGEAAVKASGGEALWRALEQGTAPASDGGWLARMAGARGKAVVTHHRSWSYFAGRFGLEVPITLEPKPGIPPGPKHVADVIALIRDRKISTIIVEPYYDRSAADSIAARSGAKVLVLANSVGGSPASTDYIALIDAAVQAVSSILK